MDKSVFKILSDRSEFKILLENDSEKIQLQQEAKHREVEQLSEAINKVRILSKNPLCEGIIPLGKRIYIPGHIVHTGEYFAEKKSHPNSFHVLQTAEQTIDNLEIQKEACEEDMDKLKEIENQINHRIQLLCPPGQAQDNLPTQIISNRGVAVRIGEFYEILEYEEKP